MKASPQGFEYICGSINMLLKYKNDFKASQRKLEMRRFEGALFHKVITDMWSFSIYN